MFKDINGDEEQKKVFSQARSSTEKFTQIHPNEYVVYAHDENSSNYDASDCTMNELRKRTLSDTLSSSVLNSAWTIPDAFSS